MIGIYLVAYYGQTIRRAADEMHSGFIIGHPTGSGREVLSFRHEKMEVILNMARDLIGPGATDEDLTIFEAREDVIIYAGEVTK